MKCSFLMSHCSPIYGMESVALRLAAEMAAVADTELLVLRGPAPSVAGVRTSSLSSRRGLAGKTVSLFRCIQWGRSGDSVIITVGVWASLPVLILGRIFFRKRVMLVWEHTLVPEKVKGSVYLRLLQLVASRVYPLACAVVGVSEHVCNSIERLCGGRCRLIRIPNISPPSSLPATMVPRGADSDLPRHLLAVSSLSPVKRVGLLLEMLHRMPESVSLKVLGDGPERPQLEAMTESLGLGDRVIFAGNVSADEVASEMAAADLLVHAAAGETFGMVYVEAAARSLPVVSTRHPVADEMIPRYVAGVVCEPSVDALVDAVSMASATDWSPLHERCRRARESEFAADRVVDAWVVAIDSCIR